MAARNPWANDNERSTNTSGQVRRLLQYMQSLHDISNEDERWPRLFEHQWQALNAEDPELWRKICFNFDLVYGFVTKIGGISDEARTMFFSKLIHVAKQYLRNVNAGPEYLDRYDQPNTISGCVPLMDGHYLNEDEIEDVFGTIQPGTYSDQQWRNYMTPPNCKQVSLNMWVQYLNQQQKLKEIYYVLSYLAMRDPYLSHLFNLPDDFVQSGKDKQYYVNKWTQIADSQNANMFLNPFDFVPLLTLVADVIADICNS